MASTYNQTVKCETKGCNKKMLARLAVGVKSGHDQHWYCPDCYFGDVPTVKVIEDPKAKPVEAPKESSKPKGKGGSKATQVREYLQANYSNKDQAVAAEKDIIDYAQELGFASRSAATSCVKANIKKVFG